MLYVGSRGSRSSVRRGNIVTKKMETTWDFGNNIANIVSTKYMVNSLHVSSYAYIRCDDMEKEG